MGAVVFVAALGIVIYFAGRPFANSGYDAALMERDPALAMTQMVTALNPNFEVVSTNDRAGTAIVRDKLTNETHTFTFDSGKKRMVAAGKERTETRTSPASNLTLPPWVPVYPGTSPQGSFSTQSPTANESTFTFRTSDPPHKVADYYKGELRAAGFHLNVAMSGVEAGTISGEDPTKKQSVVVSIGLSGGTTTGSITISERK